MRGEYADRLYLFGGFSGKLGPVADSHYYNTTTRQWVSVNDLPELITHAGVAQTATDVYFVGGYVGTGRGYQQVFGSNRVWKYNFERDSFTRIADLPQPLAGGGAAILNGRLHYFGGSTQNRNDTSIHLALDLADPSAKWEAAASLPTARNHLGHAVVNGMLYAIAGQTGNDEGLQTLQTLQVFDPATGAWSALAALPRGLSHISASTVVWGQQIVVMGGETAHNAQSRETWVYNTQTNTWKSITPLPAARFSGVAAVLNGRIYFSTGGSAATTWEGIPVTA